MWPGPAGGSAGQAVRQRRRRSPARRCPGRARRAVTLSSTRSPDRGVADQRRVGRAPRTTGRRPPPDGRSTAPAQPHVALHRPGHRTHPLDRPARHCITVAQTSRPGVAVPSGSVAMSTAARRRRAKTERLLNLVICLLYTRRPLSKAQDPRRRAAVRPTAPRPRPSTGCSSATRTSCASWASRWSPRTSTRCFDDELGYRIDQREYALPEITFEPDELAVLGLASRAWAQASLAGPAAAGAAQAAGRRRRARRRRR